MGISLRKLANCLLLLERCVLVIFLKHLLYLAGQVDHKATLVVIKEATLRKTGQYAAAHFLCLVAQGDAIVEVRRPFRNGQFELEVPILESQFRGTPQTVHLQGLR